VYFVSSLQVNIRRHITSRVVLSVYLSGSNILVWLSSEYGLNTGRTMKGLSPLTGCYCKHYTVCSAAVYLHLKVHLTIVEKN